MKTVRRVALLFCVVVGVAAAVGLAARLALDTRTAPTATPTPPTTPTPPVVVPESAPMIPNIEANRWRGSRVKGALTTSSHFFSSSPHITTEGAARLLVVDDDGEVLRITPAGAVALAPVEPDDARSPPKLRSNAVVRWRNDGIEIQRQKRRALIDYIPVDPERDAHAPTIGRCDDEGCVVVVGDWIFGGCAECASKLVVAFTWGAPDAVAEPAAPPLPR